VQPIRFEGYGRDENTNGKRASGIAHSVCAEQGHHHRNPRISSRTVWSTSPPVFGQQPHCAGEPWFYVRWDVPYFASFLFRFFAALLFGFGRYASTTSAIASSAFGGSSSLLS
jgi:hypothetical protein